MLYFLLLLLLKVFFGNQILLIQQNCEYTFQSLTFLQVSARTRRNLDQEAWTRKLSNLHLIFTFKELYFRGIYCCFSLFKLLKYCLFFTYHGYTSSSLDPWLDSFRCCYFCKQIKWKYIEILTIKACTQLRAIRYLFLHESLISIQHVFFTGI